MSEQYSNLSTDVAMSSARQFMRLMAQPLPPHIKNVSFSEAELRCSAGYVAKVSTAGIDARHDPAAAHGPAGGPPRVGGGLLAGDVAGAPRPAVDAMDVG